MTNYALSHIIFVSSTMLNTLRLLNCVCVVFLARCPRTPMNCTHAHCGILGYALCDDVLRMHVCNDLPFMLNDCELAGWLVGWLAAVRWWWCAARLIAPAPERVLRFRCKLRTCGIECCVVNESKSENVSSVRKMRENSSTNFLISLISHTGDITTP